MSLRVSNDDSSKARRERGILIEKFDSRVSNDVKPINHCLGKINSTQMRSSDYLSILVMTGLEIY